MIYYLLANGDGMPFGVTAVYYLICMVVSFGLTLGGILVCSRFLPKDQGREFAVNGALSKGKARGAGLILILALLLSSVICMPLDLLHVIFLAALFVEMMSGYLDDASEKPWGELKKGIIDLVVAVGISAAVYFLDSSAAHVIMPIFRISFTIPAWLYIVLGTVLIWASINVTNCADGVDGLCGSLSIVTLLTVLPLLFLGSLLRKSAAPTEALVIMSVFMLIAYLWFNCSPSRILMGDAGSRALGVLIAFVFMRSGMPFMYIPAALLLILDGGLGLFKLTVLRVTKSKSFMKNIRTPLHDHARKNKSWSDTQVVTRFTLLQVLLSVAAVMLAYISGMGTW